MKFETELSKFLPGKESRKYVRNFYYASVILPYVITGCNSNATNSNQNVQPTNTAITMFNNEQEQNNASEDLKTLLEYIDNRDRETFVDQIILNFTNNGADSRRIVVGDSNFLTILENTGTTSNNTGSFTVGYTMDFAEDPMNPRLIPYEVSVEERNNFLESLLENSRLENNFAIEINTQNRPLLENQLNVQTTTFIQNLFAESAIGVIRQQLVLNDSTYNFNYNIVGIDENGSLVLAPNNIGRVGSVEDGEYFEFRFYVSETERAELLTEIDNYVADIPYELLLDSNNHQIIADEMSLPVEIIQVVAEQVEITIANPFVAIENEQELEGLVKKMFGLAD